MSVRRPHFLYREHCSSRTLDRLKQIDVEFMRRLHDKVNLIPVIAKSDTMTEEEVAEFKIRVSTSLRLCALRLTRPGRRFSQT